MTQAERAAYNAGIKAAINAAQIVAITIETAEDAGTFRKQVAAGTLAAFAESATGLMLAAAADLSSPLDPPETCVSNASPCRRGCELGVVWYPKVGATLAPTCEENGWPI